MSYRNPTPIAVAILPIEGGLVAVQRAIPPIGGWAFPGGYINEGESAEQAAAREVEEETGLKLDAAGFSPIATRVTPDNKLLIFMRYNPLIFPDALDGFVANEEVSALKVVTHKDELCFPLHTAILRARRLYE